MTDRWIPLTQSGGHVESVSFSWYHHVTTYPPLPPTQYLHVANCHSHQFIPYIIIKLPHVASIHEKLWGVPGECLYLRGYEWWLLKSGSIQKTARYYRLKVTLIIDIQRKQTMEEMCIKSCCHENSRWCLKVFADTQGWQSPCQTFKRLLSITQKYSNFRILIIVQIQPN